MKSLILSMILSFSAMASEGLSENLVLKLSNTETLVETVNIHNSDSSEALLLAMQGSVNAYLISSKGRVLKKWSVGVNIFDAKLDNEGNLVVLYRDPELAIPQAVGAIRVISPKGKILWDYKDPTIHHSFYPTFSKTLLLISHNIVNDERFNKDSVLKNKLLSCDTIKEVDRSNKIVWSLDLFSLLKIPDVSELRERLSTFPSERIQSFCHTNSVREYPKTVLSNSPAVLVSLKNMNLIMLVEKKTKKILWQNPINTFEHQHDARLVGEWVYAFNNGTDKKMMRSEAVRINVKTNKREVLFEKKSFMHMAWGSLTKSGLIPMNNGNYLIVLGDPGQIWEITNQGVLVRKMHVISAAMPYEIGGTLFTSEVYDTNGLKFLGGGIKK